MTEQRSDKAIDILRSRLGPRHQSALDAGRAEIVGVLCDELRMERDQAETLVQRMVEDGQLRYVTADERDPVVDQAAQRDERADEANRRAVGDQDDLRARPGLVVPTTGGPQEGYTGLPAAAAAPVSGAGTGSPAAGPLAVNAATGSNPAAGDRVGYWDIGGETTGVKPSTTRKGQVEPRGT